MFGHASTLVVSLLVVVGVMTPGCRIGTKCAKALALELGYIGQLTVLNLTGEWYNGGEDKACE